MRFSATVLGVVAATCLTLSPVMAAAGPGGKAQKPVKTTTAKPTAVKPAAMGKPTTGKPTASQKLSAPKVSAPKASAPKASAPKLSQSGPKGGPKSPKSTGRVTTTTTTRATGKPTATGKPAKGSSTTTTATTTTTTAAPKNAKRDGTTTTTTTTPDATTLNPIAAKIASKPNLNAKLTGMLPIDPMTGKTMTLDKASLGFKNQGQFIAALHVSENLGIPFTELKSYMVTVTPGAPGEQPTATQTGSLGQAIQKAKATANVPTEVQRAELQAATDLQAPTTTTTPKTTAKGGVR